jgi:uncharacterized protein (TIRG00374 family)
VSRVPTFWVKLAVTLAIFAYLVFRVDLAASAAAIRQSMSAWLVAAFILNSLTLITSALKWHVLLRGLGIPLSRRFLLEVYTIGHFFSSFLPGVMGGDVVRWQMVSMRTAARLKIAAAILAERATGVVALVFLCPILVAIAVPQFATLPVLTLIIVMGLAVATLLALALNRRLTTILMFRSRRLAIRTLLRPLYQLQRTLRRFPRGPLLVALAYSVAFYLSAGLVFYLICRSFYVSIGFLEAATVQSLICLLILIPISLGGLGLTQAGDLYLLGILGIGLETALGISIVRLLMAYGYALLGGLLFLRRRGEPEAASRTGAAANVAS